MFRAASRWSRARQLPRSSASQRVFAHLGTSSTSEQLPEHDTAEEVESFQTKEHRVWRQHPNVRAKEERIWRHNGRSQREKRAALKSTSLGASANLVLFENAEEDKDKIGEEDKSQPKHTSSPAARSDDLPTQGSLSIIEVQASIESLRPHSSVLEDEEFKTLYKQLNRAYSKQQLREYLKTQIPQTRNLKQLYRLGKTMRNEPDSTRGDSVPTQWVAGQSALKERRQIVSPTQKPVPGLLAKGDITNAILHSAWGLSTRSGTDLIGETELPLAEWQVTMLFDRLAKNEQQYHAFINSKLLSKSTKIQLHRRHHVMRITGKQHNAEEAMNRIKKALHRVQARRGQIVLNQFSMSSRERLLRHDSLDEISKETGSVFAHDNDVLYLYGVNELAQRKARSVLLELVGMTFPEDTVQLVLDSVGEPVAPSRQDELMRLPFSSPRSGGSERARRSAGLRRLMSARSRIEGDPTAEAQSSTETAAAGFLDRSIDKVSGALAAMATRQNWVELLSSAAQLGTAWQVAPESDVHSQMWSANVSHLLQPPDSISAAASPSTSEPWITQLGHASVDESHKVSHMRLLFSYMAPTEHRRIDRDELFLQLVPLHDEQAGQAQFGPVHLRWRPYQSGSNALDPVNITMTPYRQKVYLALPDDATDLVFERSIVLVGDPSTVLQDSESTIAALNARFTGSLDSNSTQAEGEKPVQVFMPSLTPQRQDSLQHVRYTLHGVEEIHNMDFQPIQQEKLPPNTPARVVELLQRWPRDVVLRMKHSRLGRNAPWRTELKVALRSPNQSQEGDPEPVIRAALDVVQLLTHFNSQPVATTMISTGHKGHQDGAPR